MNRTPESTMDDLGGRIGVLLRERGDAVASPSIQMDKVVTGASHRRRRSRVAVSVLCVSLVVGSGYLVTQRVPQPEPAQQPPATARPVLDLYAVLDGLEPQAAFAQAGGSLWTVAQPRVDVWANRSHRLIVRTVREPVDELQTDSTIDAPTTTAQVTDAGPWTDRTVDRVQLRGVSGAVERLASDQFSVWIPTGVEGRYTQVISRGLSRSETLVAVEAMVEVDEVLQPVGSVVLVEHADPVPFSAPSSPYAQLNYGAGNSAEGPWVATFEPAQDRVSLELAMWSSTGRMETIGGRDVLLSNEYGRSSASWLDVNGLVVTVWRTLPDVEVLISSVRMVPEADFLTLAGEISDRIIASTTASNSVSFGATSVTRRTGADGAAVCVGRDGESACVREQADDEVEVANMHAELDGRWLMFGYREIGSDERATIRPAELTFQTPAGDSLHVQIKEMDGGYWYVVEVPAGVDVVTTNVGEVFGGPVGDISRPQVASVY